MKMKCQIIKLPPFTDYTILEFLFHLEIINYGNEYLLYSI